jgi:hypothetical protein
MFDLATLSEPTREGTMTIITPNQLPNIPLPAGAVFADI